MTLYETQEQVKLNYSDRNQSAVASWVGKVELLEKDIKDLLEWWEMSSSLFGWLCVTLSKFIKCSKNGKIYSFYRNKSYLRPEINKQKSK